MSDPGARLTPIAVPPADADLEQTLAALERPSSRELRVTGVSLRDRVSVSPALGRITPLSVAVRRAERRGERRWDESAAARKKATKWMAEMVGVSDRDPEAQRLGREAVIEWDVRRVVAARHRDAAQGPIHGLDNLKRARDRGRGVLLAGVHMGPPFVGPLQLATQDRPYYLVRATPGRESQGTGALVAKHHMVAQERAGNRWVDRRNAYPILRALLARGETCGLMFDSSGRVETQLAGRRTYLAGGLAALACETGAPIFPCTALRAGTRPVSNLGEAIEPGDFDGPDELHHHLAEVYTPLLLDNLVQLYPRRLPTQPRSA